MARNLVIFFTLDSELLITFSPFSLHIWALCRHPAHVMLDLSKEFGSRLWLGGSIAGTDTNLMIHNHIGAVWPAAKSVQPNDTAAIRVLRYTDGTGVVHGSPDLVSVLETVDNVITMLHNGVSVLICCVNGAHRSATLCSVLLMRLLGWSAKEVANLGLSA